jgi:hypothetical protein
MCFYIKGVSWSRHRCHKFTDAAVKRLLICTGKCAIISHLSADDGDIRTCIHLPVEMYCFQASIRTGNV